MFEELTCTICMRQFANEGDLVPRLLPECGHTFCTKCLNELLARETDSASFLCPEDKYVPFPPSHCRVQHRVHAQARRRELPQELRPDTPGRED